MREAASFFEETRGARKIVVVDFGFLGDTVHLIPALSALHTHYPEAALHVVTTPVGAEVLKLAPFVERAWPYALTRPSPPWYRSLGLVRELRGEHFDALFNFSAADRTLYLAATLGVKNRLTQTPQRWHFYNPLLSRYWAPRLADCGEIPVYKQRLKMLEAGGVPVEDVPFEITIPPGLLEEARPWIVPGAIHLSPNASSPFKEWPVERWAQLVRQVVQANPEQGVLVSSSKNPREVERVRAIEQRAQCKQLRALPAGLTIPQLAAVMSQCRLHLGCDSGPTHLAWILGVPTLTLYRKSPQMGAWAPRGPRHVQVLATCECLKRVREECQQAQESLCLGRIQTEEVYSKLVDLLRNK